MYGRAGAHTKGECFCCPPQRAVAGTAFERGSQGKHAIIIAMFIQHLSLCYGLGGRLLREMARAGLEGNEARCRRGDPAGDGAAVSSESRRENHSELSLSSSLLAALTWWCDAKVRREAIVAALLPLPTLYTTHLVVSQVPPKKWRQVVAIDLRKSSATLLRRGCLILLLLHVGTASVSGASEI